MCDRTLKPLRVRGALAPTLADHGSHDNRHGAGAAIEHVSPFGREIDEIVEAEEHEVIARMRNNRAFSHRSRANGNAGHGVFHRGSIEHPRWAEPFGRFRCRPKYSRGIIHGDPRHEDRWVTLHRLAQPLGQCLGISEFTNGHWITRNRTWLIRPAKALPWLYQYLRCPFAAFRPASYRVALPLRRQIS